MKIKKICTSFFLLMLIQFSYAIVKIQKVNIVPKNSNNNSPFNLQITFVNNGADINSFWKFGFFMPRVLKKVKGKINKSLLVKICEVNERNCQDLIYLKNSVIDKDLSAGFVSIFTPLNKLYPLKKSKTYMIIIENIPVIVTNYSLFPQSFFMIINNKILNLETNFDHYILNNYIKNNKEQADIIKNNWYNSNNNDTVVPIVPSLNNVELLPSNKSFIFKNVVNIYNSNNENDDSVNYLKDFLKNDLGILSHIDKEAGKRGIFLNLSPISNNLELYSLVISESCIEINAVTKAGIFYAIITLRQLISIYGKSLPAMKIIDYPNFKYRGLLIDVARHFFNIEEIKTIIDVMAMHKLNTLHLHLSDDEGVRIQLTKFPQLEQISSIRGYGLPITGSGLIQSNLDITNIKSESFPQINTKYRGFYSIDDIKEIIKYANARQITIIPEIDIPSHARALKKAIPDSFYDKDDFSQTTGYSDNYLPICSYGSSSILGENFTRDINAIIAEVASLFATQNTIYANAKEVSIGADEVSDDAWEKSLVCNNNRDWNLLNADEKAHKFYGMLQSNLKDKVIMSGYEEMVLSNNHINDYFNNINSGHIWVWKPFKADGLKNTQILVKKDLHVVLNYADLLYFDMQYNNNIKEPGLNWANSFSDTFNTLKSAISIKNTFKAIPVENRNNIDGIEASLWTDIIPSFTHLNYMLLPKLSAFSEVAWASFETTVSNDKVNWKSLSSRLGCGKTGFLASLNKWFMVNYRGYPNGIRLENHYLCNNIGYNFDSLHNYIINNINNGFPSVSLMIIKNNSVIFESYYGYSLKYGDNGALLLKPPLVNRNTLYDLASNTKIFATIFALMHLYYEKKIDIDKPVKYYLPEYSGCDVNNQCREDRTVRNLLEHTSGYAPSINFFNSKDLTGIYNGLYSQNFFKTKKLLLTKVPFVTKVGIANYSDINFMILGILVERITGMGLDKYTQEHIYKPLHLKHTVFNPLKNGVGKNQCAATSIYGNSNFNKTFFPNMRTKTIQCEVHDENAYYSLGGVSGHAGLFSNLHDLNILVELLINNGTYNGVTLWNRKTQDVFLTSSISEQSYALGFRKNNHLNFFGTLASRNSFGHTGFTGTLFIVDPENQLAIILLTNKRYSKVWKDDYYTNQLPISKYGDLISLIYKTVFSGRSKI